MKHFAILGLLLSFYLPASGRVSDPQKRKTPSAEPRVRLYYIAADEVMWDYTPRGRNLTGTPGAEQEGIQKPNIFRKAAYHEYTDASFSLLKPRSPDWETSDGALLTCDLMTRAQRRSVMPLPGQGPTTSRRAPHFKG